MQQKLRGLAHRPHEQERTDGSERIDVPAEEMKAFADERRRLGEDGIQIDRAGEIEHGKYAERKTEIADAIDDEGLDRGGIGFRLVIPETDQQIARQTNAFPAEEELNEVVRRHQHQ